MNGSRTLVVVSSAMVALAAARASDRQSPAAVPPSESTPGTAVVTSSPGSVADSGPAATEATTTQPPTSTSTSTSTGVPLTTPPVAPGGVSTGELTIPLNGGELVEPTPLTTIPIGSGPGQLILQNGEFLTPIALLADHVIVFEHEPFAGLTGRALVLDRDGRWQQDATLTDVAGAAVIWMDVAPSGALFVAFGTDTATRLDAYSVSADGLQLLQTVPITPVGADAFTLGPGGVDVEGIGRVMSIDTSVALDATTIRIDTRVNGSTAYVTVAREALVDSGTWTIAAELDPVSPDHSSQRGGDFGSGAWFSDVTSSDPANAQPFLAVLSTDSASAWYRLGPWAINTADAQRLLLTRQGSGGLEIAVIDAPQPHHG